MAFDIGFNFGKPTGTPAAYGVNALATHAYPHTYTNVNGFSINAGWDNTTGVTDNETDATNDPRIQAFCYISPTTTRTFQIDLSSGSAPGAGTYLSDLACGDANGPQTTSLKIKDNTTVLTTVTTQATATDHYVDATTADVTATATWTGTQASKVFASTTCNVVLNEILDANYTVICHFRLALTTTTASIQLRSMLMLIGVGS